MSTFTDYYSFLNVAVSADTDTILRAHDTKSRKLDLLEGKSHDKASIMYYRQTLADAHRILTLRATRVEYNQRWYKFKQATHRDESNNEQRSQLFSKTIESKVPASEPRSRISRSNNMRGKGEMRDQFFRRLAHKQRFLSFAAAPKTNSSSSSSNAVQLTRTSKHENWRENYLKVLCAKQQWYQTVENYATQRCRLLDQFDLAEHGIIPEGYANLVRGPHTKESALFIIRHHLQRQLRTNYYEGCKAHTKWEILEAQLEDMADLITSISSGIKQ